MSETLITILDESSNVLVTVLSTNETIVSVLTPDEPIIVSVYEVGLPGSAGIDFNTLVYFGTTGTETVLTVTNLSTVIGIWQGNTPLVEYSGGGTVPSQSFKRTGITLTLGDALGIGERLYFISSSPLSI